jgi:hypothetical protein
VNSYHSNVHAIPLTLLDASEEDRSRLFEAFRISARYLGPLQDAPFPLRVFEWNHDGMRGCDQSLASVDELSECNDVAIRIM